ncbi:MAG TPA: hypothetical protein EYP85_02200 [Armatimonadetes bacterium]|nr:hypothetical protein [Armatimonadota bacterium]
MSPPAEVIIRTTAQRARRRLQGLGALRAAGEHLQWGLAGAVFVLLGDKIGRMPFDPVPFALALVGLTFIAGLLRGVLRPLSLLQAAQRLDWHLGLAERVSTALELLGQDKPSPLFPLLLTDAAQHAAGVEVHRVWPFRLTLAWKRSLLLLPLLGLLAATPEWIWWLPPGKRAVLETSRTEGQRLAQVARRLETQAKQQQNEELRRAARRLYREALKLQRARQPKRRMLRDLAVLEAELKAAQRRLSPAVERLAASLAPLSGAERQKTLQRTKAALEALRKQLARGTRSPAERRNLASAMQRAAKELAALGLNDLAATLRETAATFLDSDSSRSSAELKSLRMEAVQALERGAVWLKEAEKWVELARAWEGAREAVAASRSQIGQAERLCAHCRRGGGTCLGGTCPGRGVRLGRAGVTRGPGTTNRAQRAGPGGQAQTPYQPGQSPLDQSEQAGWEKIYAPERLPAEGEFSRVSGTPTERGPTVRGPPQRGIPTPAPAYAPYYEVLPEYRRAAEEALSREEVPLAYRQRVKQYFEALAGQQNNWES